MKCLWAQIIELLLFLFNPLSCTSFRDRLYWAIIDKNNGDTILTREKNVRLFLENVKKTPDKYVVKAYKRNAFFFQIKKTKLMFHSFYVVTDYEGEYHTLSFYGTKMDFYSEGAWVMDADSDISAYTTFIEGKKTWDVDEIKTINGIDTTKTISNVILKIDSDIKYYYKDHINKQSNMNNCNTALKETLIEKR